MQPQDGKVGGRADRAGFPSGTAEKERRGKPKRTGQTLASVLVHITVVLQVVQVLAREGSIVDKRHRKDSESGAG